MLDKKFKALERQEELIKYWEDNNIYDFKNDGRKIFSIDTPPPTVNGKIHIGHIFSYSQTEMIARYKRMKGFDVFYPFGFDDNGLPSERLVEKENKKRAHQIGREEFSKLCYQTTDKYEAEFKELFKTMGVSSDWNYAYKTVSPETIKISQASFLEMVEKGYAYHKEAPSLWCNECITSIAQAELETKEKETTFNYIEFETTDNVPFTIATTRPELLPAIVAVFVNPKDETKQNLIGKTAKIPVVNVCVPILSDEAVDMEKGTGIVMCCTFGDQKDIEWFKKYNLPLKHILTKHGKIKDDIDIIGGLKIEEARKKIIEELENAGALLKVEPLKHEVQVHERCGKPVEYSVMKQWFIDTTSHKKDFLEMADKINWHPSYMKTRYVEWVENIMWDWCISRQRYFGVPFPVWYSKETGEVILARKEDLPVNPLVDKPHPSQIPEGTTEVVPETDVMDTWATSSITPLINMKYMEKDNLEKQLRPMSIRTNGSDIIRTWDFYTIVKSYYHFKEIPWKELVLSGFVMADKGEKISKSKGNAKVDPQILVKTTPADAIRYWAGTGRLGSDIIYSDETIKRGTKLMNKIWNLSKFMALHFEDIKENKQKFSLKMEELEYLDKYILAKYEEIEKGFLKYLESYEIGLALNHIEKFFWNFCDNYIEIVKHRLYRPEEFGEKARHSGQIACNTILFKLLQNFSIYLPFITEEIYLDMYKEDTNIDSIHITKMEKISLDILEKDTYIKNGNILEEILGELRGEKTNNGVSLKTPFNKVSIKVNKEIKKAIKESEKDLKAALFINNLELIDDETQETYEITFSELEIEEKDN